MNHTTLTWGQCDRRTAQGWMYCVTDVHWTASWSGTHNTPERDGPVEFDGTAWRSAGGRNVSYPYAVVDDFGFLAPIGVDHWPSTLNLHKDNKT